jgi:seryl-tRNA synthetase
MRDYQRALSFDFTLIADAQSFYSRNGFKDIAVPWVVDEKYIAETKPDNVKFYSTLGGVLVASAEQSFIQMLDQGWNEPGAYQATTPCFRDEPHDLLHSPYFMKTELFDNLNVTKERLHETINLALYFFNSLTQAKIENIGDGTYDIVGKNSGIELGSYGIRERNDFRWIYGTGIALPRFQHVHKLET